MWLFIPKAPCFSSLEFSIRPQPNRRETFVVVVVFLSFQKGIPFPLSFRTPSFQADGPPVRVHRRPLHSLTPPPSWNLIRSIVLEGSGSFSATYCGTRSFPSPHPSRVAVPSSFSSSIEISLDPPALLTISFSVVVSASFPVPLLA